MSTPISKEAEKIADSVPKEQIFDVILALDLNMADVEFTTKLVRYLLNDLYDETMMDQESFIRDVLNNREDA